MKHNESRTSNNAPNPSNRSDIRMDNQKDNRLEQISTLVERYRKQVEKSFRDFAEGIINMEKAQQQEVK